jgi:GNAT superfamily N-acetyltransferase
VIAPGSNVRSLVVRPAAADEFWAVARLFGALHRFNASFDPRFRLADDWEPRLRAHFAHSVAAPGALWLLAWAGSEPVGLLLVEAHQDSPLFAERRWAELVALYVTPGQRGGDLGASLVDAARRWAAAHGFDRLQLYVTTANERTRRFYARCGLAPTQEIWRLDLHPDPQTQPPPDPSCPPDDPHDPIELGHHQLAMEPRDPEREA